MKLFTIFTTLAMILSACNGNNSIAPSGSVPINEIAGQPTAQTGTPPDQSLLVYDKAQNQWVPGQAQVAAVDGLQDDLNAKANVTDVNDAIANTVSQTV
jgi:hypothetical protein